MNEELKECPFCGGEAELNFDTSSFKCNFNWRVQCKKCLSQGEYNFSSKNKAVKSWNKRVQK